MDLPPSLGGHACAWIETFLVHGPGDVQGERIVLDDELRLFVWRAYELRANGQRQFRRAFLSRPKGRGKSELAAMLAGAELCGPVRFDHYADAGEACPITGYAFTAGEPVGRPVTAPEVLCIATEEGQAGFVYQAARYMLRNGEAANSYPLDAGITRTYVGGGGSMEPVTAAANSKDGGKSTFVVADETHHWVTRELRALHAMVKRNIVKRRTPMAGYWKPQRRIGQVSNPWPSDRWTCGAWSNRARLPTRRCLWTIARRRRRRHTRPGRPVRAALSNVYGEAAAWTNLGGDRGRVHRPGHRRSRQPALLAQPSCAGVGSMDGPGRVGCVREP
jgi:hypothetical protein